MEIRATNLSEESTKRDRDKRLTCNVTRDNGCQQWHFPGGGRINHLVSGFNTFLKYKNSFFRIFGP